MYILSGSDSCVNAPGDNTLFKIIDNVLLILISSNENGCIFKFVYFMYYVESLLSEK